jgi:hypothetical protein
MKESMLLQAALAEDCAISMVRSIPGRKLSILDHARKHIFMDPECVSCGSTTLTQITGQPASALTQTDGAGILLSLARMDAAEAVHTNGFGLALCSAR